MAAAGSDEFLRAGLVAIRWPPVMTEPDADIEEAWYDGDHQAVFRLATERLRTEPAAFEAMTWLGLVHWHEGRVSTAQQTLRGAFELVRERADEETDWQRHVTCKIGRAHV